MRFLILTQYFPPEVGAAQTRLATMVKELVAQGHEVEIVTSMPNYPLGEIFPEFKGEIYSKKTWNGCDVHRYWCYASQGKTLKRLLNYLSFAFISIFAIFKCKKPDFLFVNSGPLFLSIPGWIYSKFWNVPFIFNVSDLWPRSVEHVGGLGGRLFVKFALVLESWSYKRATLITAVTEGIRTILQDEKNVPAAKILFLPNGVDLSLFNPAVDVSLRKKLGLEGKYLFVYPGNHGYAHALDKVLEAARMLAEAGFNSIHFLFVGGGSEKPRLIEMAKEMKLQNVSFLGPVTQEELVSFIDIADAGLIHVRNSPLAAETRPAKMFPIMAMEKPILYAGFGEGAEILRGIGGGEIISPEAPSELMKMAIKMSKESSKYAQMGKLNRRYIVEKMSFASLIGSWLTQLLAKQK